MVKKYELTHLVNEARTGAGKRALSARLPQVVEPPKINLLLKGHSVSEVGKAFLNELNTLKKPLCKKLQRKNEVMPFEAGGEAHMENLCRLNDCSLFTLVNHTKKRPHNVVFGRTFGHRILDMIEFGITNFMPAAGFEKTSLALESAPMVILNGDDYDRCETTQLIRSLFVDMFRGPDDVKQVNLGGLDRVIVVTLRGEKKVLVRQYAVELKRDGESPLPAPELSEVGPRFDLDVRRVQTAADGLLREAMKKARDPTIPYKRKNVSRDEMGDKVGRVHIGRQDLKDLALARMKGLGKKRRVSGGPPGADGGEGNGEDQDGAVDADVDMSGGEGESPVKKAKVDVES